MPVASQLEITGSAIVVAPTTTAVSEIAVVTTAALGRGT